MHNLKSTIKFLFLLVALIGLATFKHSALNATVANEMTAKIKGGYYLKSRKIQGSAIARCSPVTREIWDWLIMTANHKDSNDGKIKRGQLFVNYTEIRDALRWNVGYRTEYYSKDQIKKSMKTLRRHSMVALTKAPGGVLVTVLNYDTYQNPKNYEGTNEGTNEGTALAPSIKTRKKKNVKKEDIVETSEEDSNGVHEKKIDDIYYRAVDVCIEKIKLTHPNVSISKKVRNDAAADFDKLVRIDKKSLNDLRKILDWLPNSHTSPKGFSWKNVVQSPTKFRKKADDGVMYFDKIYSAMTQDNSPQPTKSTVEETRRMLEEKGL